MAAPVGRHVERAAIALAAAIVLVATVPPLAGIAFDLVRAGAAGFGARAAFVLARSFALAAIVTALACAIGAPLGILVGRFDLSSRRTIWAVHAFPAAVPPFLLALGWSHALRGAPFLFTDAGVVLVLVLALSPIVTSLVALAAAAIEPALEDAARVWASPFRVATRVLLPACRPALGLAGVIVFALAFSELGVPMFLRVDAYPAYVLTRLGGVEWLPGEAAALAMPLAVVTLVVFAIERRIARTGVIGRAPKAERAPMPLPHRVAFSIGAWIVALAGCVPLVALLFEARFADAWPWLGDAPRNSIVAAASAATLITAAGFVIARSKGRRLAEGLATLTFVLPSSLLGVGIVVAWNRGATQFVYGTIAIVALGFVARYSVIGIAASTRALASVPPHLDESARVFGAGFVARLVRVLLPATKRGVLGAWLLAFVFCVRDLETPVLFYPAGAAPLTVRIFTLEANGSPGVVAALALVEVAIVAVAILAGWLVVR